MSKKTKNRYTDKELESFRKIINEKIEKAKTDLDLLKSAYMNDSNNGTDDTSPTFKSAVLANLCPALTTIPINCKRVASGPLKGKVIN